MTAPVPDKPNGWLVRDSSIYHPDYSPDEEGFSLQDIRDYYLWRQKTDLDPSVEAAPWYVVNPSAEVSSHLCNVCRHLNLHWLVRNSINSDYGPILLLRHMLTYRHSCSFCRLGVAALCTADGQDLDVNDLEDGNNVIGCWIFSRKPIPSSNGPAVMTIWRRRLFVTGGFVGQAGLLQQIGSSEDDCLGRRVASCTDLGLVRDWFKMCEEQHADIPSQVRLLDSASAPSGSNLQLRVIDVQDRCIVVGNEQTRYVALSYVWGKVDQLKLLMSNVADLSTKRAFSGDRLGSRLPRTISDAIELVAALGERYLWVDALCLIQDGPDFAAQVQNMDIIYGRAAWTLVAGSADSATTPLPRFTPSTDKKPQVVQYTELIAGMTFGVVLPSLQATLQNAVWDQRAWTYQESTLSKRLLVVTNPQMFFTCRHGYTYYEDNRVEDMLPSQIDRNGQVFGSATAAATNFEVYADAVTEYTSRQMSFLEDGLNAISGVLSQFCTWFRGEFLSGLPSTELDQALLWYPKGDIIRRKNQLGNDIFPSWSWAGWVGQCGYLSGLALSCVRWNTVDLHPLTSSTHCTSDDLRRPINDRELLKFQEDWKEMGPSFSQGESSNFTTHLYDSCWYEQVDTRTLYLHPVSAQSVRPTHPASKWKTDCLEFQALTCFFSITGDHADVDAILSLPCSINHHGLCALSVRDAMGRICGTVHVPASASASIRHGEHEFIRLSRTHLSSDGTRYSDLNWDPCEFSSLSERAPGSRTQVEDSESEGNECGVDDGCMFDTDVFDIDEPWCVFNVMLIETTRGLSRRVGLGKVHVAAFTQDQGAYWRDIVLA